VVPEDHRIKCLKVAPVVTRSLAKNVFTVFYPLIGKIFYQDIKMALDKITSDQTS